MLSAPMRSVQDLLDGQASVTMENDASTQPVIDLSLVWIPP